MESEYALVVEWGSLEARRCSLRAVHGERSRRCAHSHAHRDVLKHGRSVGMQQVRGGQVLGGDGCGASLPLQQQLATCVWRVWGGKMGG